MATKKNTPQKKEVKAKPAAAKSAKTADKSKPGLNINPKVKK